MDKEIIVAIVGLAGVLGSVWLGAYLNRRSSLETAIKLAELGQLKYAQDRLWDARKDAYAAIVAHVRATARLASIVDHGYNSGELHPEDYHASDASTKEIAALWHQWSEAKAEFENARLLVSDNFVTRFEKLEEDLTAVDRDDLPPNIYSDGAAIFNAAVQPMVDLARFEIQR